MLLGGSATLMLLGLCWREAWPGVASVWLLAARRSDKEENQQCEEGEGNEG